MKLSGKLKPFFTDKGINKKINLLQKVRPVSANKRLFEKLNDFFVDAAKSLNIPLSGNFKNHHNIKLVKGSFRNNITLFSFDEIDVSGIEK